MSTANEAMRDEQSQQQLKVHIKILRHHTALLKSTKILKNT